MSRPTPLERLGGELEAAAARQVGAAPAVPRRRRWRWQGLAVTILAVGAGAGAAAWAGTSLLSSGSPVPFQRGAPIAGRAQGAPIPGTVKLLTDDVADPGGGAPWGLRYWETDRKYGCLQVGRVHAGELGQISGGKVFHALRLGVTRGGLGGCFVLDGGGHAFTAIHTHAERGAQPQPCPGSFRPGTELRGLHGAVTRCETPDRTVDFGLLGPNAKSLTYRAGGEDHTTTPLGGVGAYLVVQKRLQPVIREFGFHHRDPKLNLRGPAEPYIGLTPGSQVIKRITYTRGTCVVHVTAGPYGACNAMAGFVPIPQPQVGDVRAPIRAFAAPAGRGIRVRFRARQAVVDGRSGYNIEVRPVGARGFMTQTYSRNVEAGDMVRTTVDLYNKRRGPYRIVVRYRTVSALPGPYASLGYPGLLVGQARVDVR
ncbi:MAG TPA: hypothetical protein VK501_07300 [Baekduia sp.]|uniref:hypothetical protein n=1 Tax=Baekduia sp. TaxID=2600305 RepID=UPI002C3E8BB4|nr:hypothetical protein [Baekduia sp.]HMJ33708.1 hypothetical protein [Baekduia sp.]